MSGERNSVDRQRLGLWDAVSLVIGIVVGTSIFRTAPEVFRNTGSPGQGLAAWALGGVLSLVGALCYAELATTYARNGGDYEYLTQAYGRWAGFIFGWAQLVAVWTASVGTMAYSFGDYGVQLFELPPAAAVWLAAASVVGVALVNIGGMKLGKWTQNVLTAAKVLGLSGVVVAGLLAARSSGSETLPANAEASPPASLALAMVFVLYAYGGWNDAAYVTAEVRNRQRNLPLALVGGVAGVTVIYLAVNAAYLATLGFEGARQSMTPASDALNVAVGPISGKLAAVLVMISALGAINGMIFAGSRVFAAFGADHRLFHWLGKREPQDGSPWAAIVAQAAVTLAMICGVGTEGGRGAIDRVFELIGVAGIPWAEFHGGFGTLLAATAPVFWALFLAVGVGLFMLRWKNPGRERPFSVPLYPLPPLVFCATCGFMLFSSVQYARWLALFGAAPVAAGLAVYVAMRLSDRFRRTNRFAR
jgi:amino acid transporter